VTLTVALTAEEEAKLLAEARARGVSPDALVRDALKDLLGKAERPAATAAMTPEERARAFVEWTESFPPTTLLSDHAITRESFYRDDAK
jgi:hypothetical protein